MSDSVFNVKGMTCGSCVRHINQALSVIDGVEHVDVRLRDGRVLVRHAPNLPTDKLVVALDDAGYEAHLAGD